jgi:hypothetical protein
VLSRSLRSPFDDDGVPYVVESGYSYGEVLDVARLLRIGEEGPEEIASSGAAGWMGVDYANGSFFVAEAGILKPGRILRIDPDGSTQVLVDGLPSLGDHHVNGPVVKDGQVFFSVGTATNSGVVGTDNADFGWLKRFPRFHDVACKDIVLRGDNFHADDPITQTKGGVDTGPYQPFGTPAQKDHDVGGRAPGARHRRAVARGARAGGRGHRVEEEPVMLRGFVVVFVAAAAACSTAHRSSWVATGEGSRAGVDG